MIGLLDCNNFFVSCERLFRPDLKQRPVVVLSSNDGCVVARSQEVKDRGIAMGVPYFRVKDSLKDMGATAFSSHFALYRDISRRVFEVIKREVAVVEVYSIDECFFAVDSAEAEELAWRLKQTVERLVGIPVSVGVASSKTVAKYANSIAKKTSGVKVLSHSEWEDQASSVTLSSLWGVGEGRRRQFAQLSITTAANLMQADRQLLGRQCGIEGLRLQAELGGQAAYPLAIFQPPQKSMMSSRSFAKESTDLAVLEDAISYHTRQISNDLSAQGQQAVAIRVMAYPSRYSDYFLQGLSLEAVFTVPTADLFTLTREALRLLRSGFRAGVPYKKAGVSISSTMQKEAATPSLFAADTNQLEALNLTIATLTKKHGRGCIELGRVLNRSHGWQANTGALSPAYTTAWSDLKTVKA